MYETLSFPRITAFKSSLQKSSDFEATLMSHYVGAGNGNVLPQEQT